VEDVLEEDSPSAAVLFSQTCAERERNERDRGNHRYA
jgi:hypothetical protein